MNSPDPALQQCDQIDALTAQVIEIMANAQMAAENLARERAKRKMSSCRASALARELKQLGAFMRERGCRQSADMI